MVNFQFLPGQLNPADILSKHWGYSQVWTRLKALLFWYGDTLVIQDDDVTSNKRGVTKFKQGQVPVELPAEFCSRDVTDDIT
jgi:hypothetical protein